MIMRAVTALLCTKRLEALGVSLAKLVHAAAAEVLSTLTAEECQVKSDLFRESARPSPFVASAVLCTLLKKTRCTGDWRASELTCNKSNSMASSLKGKRTQHGFPF